MTYIPDQPVGLRWTGHPFIDMGVAGLTVFAQKRNPEEVTGLHLEEFAKWAEQAYKTKEIEYFIQQAFGRNRFFNARHSPEQRQNNIKLALQSFNQLRAPVNGNCTFFDLPALTICARDLVPMLNGQGISNFYPDGESGLPLSGLAVTTLQAMSISTPVVSNRLLVLAPDDRRLLLRIINNWQSKVRERVQLSVAAGEKGAIWSYPKTRLIDVLIDLERNQEKEIYFGGITVYHASNSGQDDKLDIFILNFPAITFVRKAQNVKYAEAWQRLIASSWREAEKDKDSQFGKRNDVYENLFDLPQESAKFLQRFFLAPVRNQLKPAQPADKPKRGKKTKTENVAATTINETPPIALWSLLELFLQEVLGMEQSRISSIRNLADRLAGAVEADNDRRLFRKIYRTRKPYEVRQLLIQMGMRRLKDGQEPAIKFDEYLDIFEEGDELARADFGLAWDLTRMRVIETLFEKKWFDGNEEVLAAIDEVIEAEVATESEGE